MFRQEESCLQRGQMEDWHINHLTDRKVLEEAMDLNSRLTELILLFIVLELVLIFALSTSLGSVLPDLVYVLTCMALAFFICFFLYRWNQQFYRFYITSRMDEIRLEKAEFLRVTRDIQKPKCNAANYSYTVRARLPGGKRVKTTIFGEEAKSYEVHRPDTVYVLILPRFPGSYCYRIYHSWDFSNQCREIRLNREA